MGILKNKTDVAQMQMQLDAGPLDKQTVIANTRANAKLRGDHSGVEIAHRSGSSGNVPLHWDEKNLAGNSIQQESGEFGTMSIDEPKTPYLGGFDPKGEYYADDDNFELGEGEDEEESRKGDGEKNEKQERDAEGDVGEEEEEVQDAEDEPSTELDTPLTKHQLFELKRKQHYFHRGNALKHPVKMDEEEDEEEETNEA